MSTEPSNQQIVRLIAALVVLPVAVYTLWIAYEAWTESAEIRSASDYAASTSHINGTLYRHEDTPLLELAMPNEFPEIINAVQYKVEKQVLKNGVWEKTGKTVVAARQTFTTVDNAKVELSSTTLFSWPITQIEKTIDATTRLYIRSRPLLPPGQTHWVVYGTYQQGRLTDGNLQRLLVLNPEREEEIVQGIARNGKIKGSVLLLVALLLCGVSAWNIRLWKKA